MNVFFTNRNPHVAANEHCKVHMRKMIVEYCQLMSTAHAEYGTWVDGMYKPTHVNHPSAIWVRANKQHYMWLYRCTLQLVKLYEDSTGNLHASRHVLAILKTCPVGMPDFVFIQPPIAAPEPYKSMDDACVGYQLYLNSKFAEWLERDKPIDVSWVCKKPHWYRE